MAILLFFLVLNINIIGKNNTIEKGSPTIKDASQFTFLKTNDGWWQEVEALMCINKLNLKIEMIRVTSEIEKNVGEHAFLDKKEIVDFIRSFDWDDTVAIQVFIGESGLNEKVISKTNDVGVAQINMKAHYENIPGDTTNEKIEWLKNYKNNISFAYKVYKDAGNSFSPWVYYNAHLNQF